MRSTTSRTRPGSASKAAAAASAGHLERRAGSAQPFERPVHRLAQARGGGGRSRRRAAATPTRGERGACLHCDAPARRGRGHPQAPLGPGASCDATRRHQLPAATARLGWLKTSHSRARVIATIQAVELLAVARRQFVLPHFPATAARATCWPTEGQARRHERSTGQSTSRLAPLPLSGSASTTKTARASSPLAPCTVNSCTAPAGTPRLGRLGRRAVRAHQVVGPGVAAAVIVRAPPPAARAARAAPPRQACRRDHGQARHEVAPRAPRGPAGRAAATCAPSTASARAAARASARLPAARASSVSSQLGLAPGAPATSSASSPAPKSGLLSARASERSWPGRGQHVQHRGRVQRRARRRVQRPGRASRRAGGARPARQPHEPGAERWRASTITSPGATPSRATSSAIASATCAASARRREVRVRAAPR